MYVLLLKVLPQIEPYDIQALGRANILLLILAAFVMVSVMALFLWVGWWFTQRSGSVSPYSGKAMRKGNELAYAAMQEVCNYLESFDDLDNRDVSLERAAICRETGRIFADAITAFGVIWVGWSFVDRRYPGNWVSWGSLSPIQQGEVRRCHDTLEGFQVELSCPRLRPCDIDSYHALAKPGPLYVDLRTKVLMGWKMVPGTLLEVLIVQRPHYELEYHLQNN